MEYHVMRLFLPAALAVALLTGSTEAETNPSAFLTGNDLFARCRASNHDSCWGYVSGIADTMSIVGAGLGWRACVPDPVRVSQVADVVTRFLSEHPELRHFGAPGLVAAALAGAFPCPAGPDLP